MQKPGTTTDALDALLRQVESQPTLKARLLEACRVAPKILPKGVGGPLLMALPLVAASLNSTSEYELRHNLEEFADFLDAVLSDLDEPAEPRPVSV